MKAHSLLSNTLRRNQGAVYKLCLIFILSLLTAIHAHVNIRLLKVDPAKDEITLKNFSTHTDEPAVDVGAFVLTITNASRIRVSTLTRVSGTFNLLAQQTVVVKGLGLANSNGLGFYNSGTTATNVTDPDKMADFVQWGRGGLGREAVAVEKGIWAKGDFLEGNGVYTYTGDGTDQNGKAYWSRVAVTGTQTVPTISRSVVLVKHGFLLKGFTASNIEIFDIGGERVWRGSTPANGRVSLENLSPGRYLLRIREIHGQWVGVYPVRL